MKTLPQRRKGQNDMQLARGRLRGALNESLAVSDDDENIEEDLPQRGRPSKNLNSIQRDMQSPRSSRNSSLSPGKYLTPTKRRKREPQLLATGAAEVAGTSTQPSHKIQAESFVMKLFDRSLDLSKYTEQTALYPICRAWMANQPRNSNIPSYRDKRSPSPVEREDNAAELLSKLQSGEIHEVTAMPAPQPTDVPKIPVLNRAIPEEQSRTELDAAVTGSNGFQFNFSKEELLGMNVNRWRLLKSSWMKQLRCYQKRNEENNLILQELFKP